jgi:DNA sulfur modification protein DndB
MTGPLLLPALQGVFGSWNYYASLMRLSDVSERVQYARDIHQNEKLNDMIQRRLDDKTRAQDIAEYLLKTTDRFFNSLVVGVYGGDPQWLPFDVKPRNKSHLLDQLDERDRESVGYLEFNGREDLFALDGQHRLAGIKAALAKNALIGDERVSVIFVSHSKTPAGMKRTRSLFVAINKKAVAVNRRDIIALDEVDPAAILTRELVDQNKLLCRGQVDVDRFTNSIPAAAPALTTIGNLYDLVRVALNEIVAPEERAELQAATRVRMKDRRLQHYSKLVSAYLNSLFGLDATLAAALAAADFGPSIVAGRTPANPRLLYRPIGLLIVTRVVAALRKTRSLDASLKLARKIPMLMTEAPFAGVIWERNRMQTTNASLATRLLLHMLGERQDVEKLRQSLATLRDVPVAGLRLPNKLV